MSNMQNNKYLNAQVRHPNLHNFKNRINSHQSIGYNTYLP